MADIQRIADITPFQKPHDSIFSTLITRKISRVCTFVIVKYAPRLTPNYVSTISFVLSVIACGLFLAPNYAWRVVGALLLQFAFALDCSDGELARIKNLTSKFGAWLDSVFDRFKEFLMLGTMTLSWYWYHGQAARTLIVGAVAIIGLQLVSYLREAKKSSWPSRRTSELYITKTIYIGTVDVTIYLVTAAVIFNLEIVALWLFLLVSLPLLIKQLLSAYRLGKEE